MFDVYLSEVKDQINQGNIYPAQVELRQYIKKYPHNEIAWLLLALTVQAPAQTQYCLEQAQKINPQNHQVSTILAELIYNLVKVKNTHAVKEEAGEDQLDQNISIDYSGLCTSANIKIEKYIADLEIEDQPTERTNIPEENSWEWICDGDGYYLWCSPQVAGVLGIPGYIFKGEELTRYRLVPKSQLAVAFNLQAGVFPVDVPVYFVSEREELVPVNLQIHESISGKEGRSGLRGQASLIKYEDGAVISEDQDGFDVASMGTSDSYPENSQTEEANGFSGDRVCSYLRSTPALESSDLTASSENRCQRSGKPITVVLRYQQNICLTEKYMRCPVYAAGIRWPGPRYISISELSRVVHQRRVIFLTGLTVLTLIVLIVLFLFVYFSFL